MVCTACGTEQVAGSHFCARCGAPLPVAPAGLSQQAFVPPYAYGPYAGALAAEQRRRVRQNLQPLGITWIIFGVFRLMTGLIGALIVHHLVMGGIFSDAPQFLPHILSSLVPVIAAISIVMGLANVFVGYGLLARHSWARILAMMFGILSLIKIPFGTALGIYTLWVLAPRASAAEWDAISREAQLYRMMRWRVNF